MTLESLINLAIEDDEEGKDVLIQVMFLIYYCI